MSFVPCRNTVGPVTNSADGCVNQSFNRNVFGSRATIAFALPSPVTLPGPTAASSVLPADENATEPTTPPPLVRYDATGLSGESRSIAKTAFGAPPQFPDVAAYISVPTATGFDHREFAGR